PAPACTPAPARSGAPHPAPPSAPAPRPSARTPRPAARAAREGLSVSWLMGPRSLVLRRGRLARPVRLRRAEQQVEQLAVGGEQERGLVVAQDALVLLQLLEEGVELRVLALGVAADA